MLAMLAAAWLGRPRRFVENYDQVKQFHRFCEAMEDEVAKSRSEEQHRPITRTVE